MNQNYNEFDREKYAKMFEPEDGNEDFSRDTDADLSPQQQEVVDKVFDWIKRSLFLLYILSGSIVAFSFIRLFSGSSVEVKNNGEVVSSINSPLPFEPQNYVEVVDFYTGLILGWGICFTILSFIPQRFPYRLFGGTKKDFKVPFVMFSLPAWFIAAICGASILFTSSSSTFEKTVEQIYGDSEEYGDVRMAAQDKKHSSVNSSSTLTTYADINRFIKSFTGEKPKGGMLLKNAEPTYRLFYIVNVKGEPHLIASNTPKIENTKQIKDLGKLTNTEKDTLISLTSDPNWIEAFKNNI